MLAPPRACVPVAWGRSRALSAPRPRSPCPARVPRSPRSEPRRSQRPGVEFVLLSAPARVGHRRCRSGSQRSGQHGRRFPGLGRLKISGPLCGAAIGQVPGTSMQMRPRHLRAAGDPGSWRAKKGHSRWGPAGAPGARPARTPAQPSRARVPPARRGRLSSFAAPSP